MSASVSNSKVVHLIIERTNLENLEKKHHYDPGLGSLKMNHDKQTSFPFLDSYYKKSSNLTCPFSIFLMKESWLSFWKTILAIFLLKLCLPSTFSISGNSNWNFLLLTQATILASSLTPTSSSHSTFKSTSKYCWFYL